MPEIGVASSIAVAHLSEGEDVTDLVNDWLSRNINVDVIDMKFATSATEDQWSTDVLIIYRKEI